MKAFSFRKRLTGVGLFLVLVATGVRAAPLTWFPGPSLDYANSSAATVVMSGYGNVVVGGDFSVYAEGLIATNSYWTPLTQTLWGTYIAPGAVASGGQIILFGGTDGTASMSTAIDYSPSDTAAPLASMSVPRSYLGYAGDRGGNAYAIGGLDGSGQPLASGEKLTNPDGSSGAWTPIASLPAPRYRFPAVFDGTDLIYIFGGYNDTNSGVESSSVMRYSISGNTWTTLAPLPVAVAGSCATLGADGEFYVVGGLSGGVATNLVQVYNPAANSWVISTPLPESLSASVMGVDSLGRLLVMGGMDTNGNDTADVWRSQQLGVPDTMPVLTQFPTTSATYGAAYISSINATGNPQPVYELVNGPAGMTVDYYTGAINWTPQGVNEVGSIPVTIAATNYAGATNWSFNITVPNPRPVLPTGIRVVSVTDNSVTLAWDPEDPIYGAVTYSLAIPHAYHSPKGSGGGVNYQVIATGIATNNGVTLSGLAPGTSTTFDLSATGPGGTTGFAYNGIVVTTTAPQGPTNLWITGLTSTSISLAWTPSPGPAQSPLYSTIVSYTIMRHDNGATASVPAVVGLTGTNGTVSGLTPGQSHTWYIAGVDAQGYVSAAPYFAYIVATNSVPARASLSGGSPAAGGGFQFSIQPGTMQTTLIQATTNPADPLSWTTIFTNPIGGGPLNYTDAAAGLFPARFYRVVSP
jgi:hypothetical protein